jgi:cadherin 23
VFYVQDKPGNKVYQSVRFVILDIDDNPPVFKNTPYKVSVIENQSVGSTIFTGIEAYDTDGPLYNKFTFSLAKRPNDMAGDQDLFAVERSNYVSSGHFNASVLLREKLDYEKSKTHVLTIMAAGENSQFVSFAELLVNVIDYPDRPPEFSQSPYYVKIEEEMSLVSLLYFLYFFKVFSLL